MTETAVREGVASVLVKDYAQARARYWSKRYPGALKPVENLPAAIVADSPDVAAKTIIRAPSPDGPLAVGFVQ